MGIETGKRLCFFFPSPFPPHPPFFPFSSSHNIACEIQATLPLPPSTVRRMLTSVHLTFALTAACYFSVAISGFWAFGNGVAPNILTTLSKPVGVVVAANLAVFLHVLGKGEKIGGLRG